MWREPERLRGYIHSMPAGVWRGDVMQNFHCARCQNPVFFENHQCVGCGHSLAYLPDERIVTSLDGMGEERTAPAAGGRLYRLCANYTSHHICNWAIPADSPHVLCESCRLTRVIPGPAKPEWQFAWHRLEIAKRRVVRELMMLGLPVIPRSEDPIHGLAFEFLADPVVAGAPPVVSGHAHGVITMALAEADDGVRERRRIQRHEPVRTLLGHFRHETGHYYWNRLVRDSARLEDFRMVFGDERVNHGEALRRYHDHAPPSRWTEQFISSYASAHPWEDWAETWACYLHIWDALETTAASRLRVTPVATKSSSDEFTEMMSQWHTLIHVLNHLNDGLGLPDAHPFVRSVQTMKKMRFVHDTIELAAASLSAAA